MGLCVKLTVQISAVRVPRSASANAWIGFFLITIRRKGKAWEDQKRTVVPVYNRMNSHKSRPPRICRIEMCQLGAVRIRPPGAHKDGLYTGPIGQVLPESLLHGHGVLQHLQVVITRRGCDEVVDFLKWMRGDNVYRLYLVRQSVRTGQGAVSAVSRIGRGGWLRQTFGEAGEDDNQQYEALRWLERGCTWHRAFRKRR